MASNRASQRRKKGKPTAKSGPSIGERWQSFKAGKSPILIFLMKFCAVLIPFYAIWMTSFFKTNILYGWNCLNTIVASFVLNIFGAKTTATGDVLAGPNAAIKIFEGCDGIEPTMLLIAGIIAFPTAWKLKPKGMLFGSLFLLGVNFIRILSLYIIQLHWPAAFEFMHLEFWQVAFIVLAIIVWVYWIRKIPNEKEEIEHEGLASQPT